MLVVAGLSLKNLEPRVWDPASPYHIPELRAVMVSYAEFRARPAHMRAAMERGLHHYLDVPAGMQIYLDNGAYALLRRGGETPPEDYEAFVAQARPDWWPIPRDYIPSPAMPAAQQDSCFVRTMAVNRAYRQDGYVPVVHIGRLLDAYVAAIVADEQLAAKPAIALGGIVPNLLRAPKAIPYDDILAGLMHVRTAFVGRQVHIFGVGGTATLHLLSLLGIDSADSSGWRNRAAHGIVQLPGRGDRMVANLGSWRGRAPSAEEWSALAACLCPACRQFGVEGLRRSGLSGFCNRATHNLAVLLGEARAIEERLADGTYAGWFEGHLDNSIYLPLIRQVVALRAARGLPVLLGRQKMPYC